MESSKDFGPDNPTHYDKVIVTGNSFHIRPILKTPIGKSLKPLKVMTKGKETYILISNWSYGEFQ